MFALGASGIKEILDSLVRQGCPSEKNMLIIEYLIIISLKFGSVHTQKNSLHCLPTRTLNTKHRFIM